MPRSAALTYSEILDIAAAVFDTNGYHQTTMQNISDAAGLTKGGLYHHLQSKEATLFAINERYILEGLDQVRKVVQDQGLSLDQRLHRVVVTIAAQHDAYHHDLRLTLREFDSISPPFREQLTELRDLYQGTVKGLIVEAIAAGLIVDRDPELILMFLFGVVNWMCMWYRVEGRYAASEIGEQFADLILRALRAGSVRPRQL
jgi:AcrR family transcriptional regulator